MVSPTAAVICFHRIVRPKLAGNWPQSCANTLPESHRNLLEPGPPLHQGVPEPSPKPSPDLPEPHWTWPGLAPTSPETFSDTFRNLVLAKASPEPSPLPFPERRWTCFSGTFRNLVEPRLALHQRLPERSMEPRWTGTLPEPSWTWPGTCTRAWNLLRNLLQNLLRNLPEPSPEPSPESCWTWPGACTKASRNLLRNLLRDLVELDLFRTKPPGTFWNLLRNLVEPAPVHTGAILGWRPH